MILTSANIQTSSCCICSYIFHRWASHSCSQVSMPSVSEFDLKCVLQYIGSLLSFFFFFLELNMNPTSIPLEKLQNAGEKKIPDRNVSVVMLLCLWHLLHLTSVRFWNGLDKKDLTLVSPTSRVLSDIYPCCDPEPVWINWTKHLSISSGEITLTRISSPSMDGQTDWRTADWISSLGC